MVRTEKLLSHVPWCQYQLSYPLFHPEFSSLTFLEFAVLTGFFLSYYCCPLQGPWRTNSWFIKHCVWRKASISVHKIVITVGCVLLFFTNNQDSECLFYSFTFNHALSITTQRQVWATSLLSQIRQLYYALEAKEVVTESLDSRGREGWVSVLALWQRAHDWPTDAVGRLLDKLNDVTWSIRN